MEEPEQTLAATQATTPDVIDLDKLVLIGLFQTTEGPAALIRNSSGQVARITPGMRALGVMATAIGDRQVLLTGADGVTLAMQMPQTD